jgi:signal peptidase I
MFSVFKKNPDAELHASAAALAQHIRKVWNYRRDTLENHAADRLCAARANLETQFAKDSAADAEERTAAVEEAHAALLAVGGKIYPSRLLPEWIELIIVAAIIACSVRSFFVQPFKIPTNSMYPTYHGMTCEVFPLENDGPSGATAFWRKLTRMATRVEARASKPGEVLIPIGEINENHTPSKIGEGVDSGLFGTGLLASPSDEFHLAVGDPATGDVAETVTLATPKEFSFTSVVLKTYFPTEAALPISEPLQWVRVLRNAENNQDILTVGKKLYLRTHRRVVAGGRLANFDVITGDLVLVERVSYNFTRPKAGDPFVFATKNIPGIGGNFYYIKRLVGEPGDRLEVRPPALLRNDKPISGKPAFAKNNAALASAEYYGYTGGGALNDGDPLPAGNYFAMGDNSGNSRDSREWGLVPEREIIGRGFFILYPFASRWGLAE